MASQAHEFKAKTVDEAIEEGLAALKVQREAVDIEVVNRGSRGIFGIGSEPAVVRITQRVLSPTPTLAPTTPAVNLPVAAPAPPPAANPVAPKVVDEAPVTPVRPTPAPVAPTVQEDAEEEQSGALSMDADAEESHNDLVMETMAVEMLDRMIYLMGFDATVTATWQDEDEGDFDDEDGGAEEGQSSTARRYLHLDVEGVELGALIGRRGETLENIQYLLRLMVNQKLHRWKNIIIDIERYKARRVTQLTQLAQRMAEQVAHSRRAVSLEPMPANERRIVHMALRDHPDVYTESYGDGNRRKVHIFAKD